jgi:hypothetical protein
MKKIFLLSMLVAFISLNIIGQVEKPIKKGYFVTGGSLSIEGKKYKKTDPDINYTYYEYENKFNTNIYFGYFIFKHFATGLKVDYALNRYKFNQGTILYTNTLTLEPFLRYYTPIAIFGETSIGYGFNKYGTNKKNLFEDEVFTWSLGLGYSLFINKNIAIEPVFSYAVVKKIDSNYESDFIKDKGLSLQIGVQLYFNISKKSIQRGD